MIYIYALRCPIADAIRYIGKTKDPRQRLAVHLSKSKKQLDHHCARWIRGLVEQGLTPTLEILRTLGDGADWQGAEQECITAHLASGHLLVNSTGGGDGFHNVPADVLRKRGESRRKTLSAPERHAEFVGRMNASRNNPNTRAAQSAGVKAAWADPHKREKMLAGLTPEGKRRRVDSVRAANVITNASRTAKLQAFYQTPDGRQLASVRSKAMHADSEVSARRAAAIRAAYAKPELRAKIAAASKAAWARRKTAQE